MSETRPAPSRVERALESACLASMLALLGVGVPFALKYQSAEAVYWGYSPRYLYGVVIPLALLCCATLALALARDRARRLAMAAMGRLPRPVAAALCLVALALALVYAFTISDEYVSLLMLLALPGALALVWGAAVRDGTAANVQLACLPFLICGVVLFAVELPDLASGSPLAIWGDTSTFATLFPREAPFIGRGGRLRPGLDVRMRAPEYRSGARLVTNSAGFRNAREFPEEPAPGELRVLSLGDSFSTGFCADQDSFFGSLLERRLAARAAGGAVAVLNAEVSDPAYGLRYLQEFGMAYHPSLVLYGLSGNDMMQAEQFYGAGRLFLLDDNGRIVANPGFDPSIESAWVRYRDLVYPAPAHAPADAPGSAPPILGRLLSKLTRFRLLSALAAPAEREASRPALMPSYAESFERTDGKKRLIDGSANLGFFLNRPSEPVERMYAAAFELLAAMDRTARQGGARFMLVIYPQRYQVQPNDWEFLKVRWGLDEGDFDLTLANRRLAAFCDRERIACCDLVQPFRDAAAGRTLFLPEGDTHFNRRGHETAAAAVEQCVARLPGPG